MAQKPEAGDIGGMADEIFELSVLTSLLRARKPSGPDDLSEAEFLTLDLLVRQQPVTIGDLQKHVGVLPAQMSRIIRALEERKGKGYVTCSINREDRRRIDVMLTEAGRKAHGAYRAGRLATMHQTLECLSDPDRTEFMRMLRVIRRHLESAGNSQAAPE